MESAVRRLYGFLVVALFPALLAAQTSTRSGQRPPIIDMHMHANPGRVVLGPDGKPVPAPCDPQPCKGIPTTAATDEAVLQLTLEAMDRHNIVMAFLSGVDLTHLHKWVAAAPNRFIPSPHIYEPGKPSADMLRPEYSSGRLSAMGEIGTQYNGFRPDDPKLEPYFALAEELDLPVHIHTLGIGAHRPGFRVAAGNPVFLEDVLVRHPKLRLFVENAGFPFTSEMIAMMYQYPQLYADISTITWLIPSDAFHDHLRALVRAGLGKRLMFGSDQMMWPETIALAIEAIETANFLSEEQKRDIFYNNAARFLRLSQEEIARHHGK